jgi:hypothetical protein
MKKILVGYSSNNKQWILKLLWKYRHRMVNTILKSKFTGVYNPTSRQKTEAYLLEVTWESDVSS